MGRKGRKLTEDQQRWLGVLQEFLKHRVKFQGNQNLKESIEGKFAVVCSDADRGPDYDVYCSVVGADDFPGAEVIAKWTPNPHMLIVELEAGEVLKEIKKPWGSYDKRFYP